MANLSLDPSFMLDVQLTQRMLLNIPSYQGKAGLDTYVISSRQPLLQGGFNECIDAENAATTLAKLDKLSALVLGC